MLKINKQKRLQYGVLRRAKVQNFGLLQPLLEGKTYVCHMHVYVQHAAAPSPYVHLIFPSCVRGRYMISSGDEEQKTLAKIMDKSWLNL